MRSSIENWKENLNKIALDVHEDDEFSIYDSGDSAYNDRRWSHRRAHSNRFSDSPVSNGVDSPLLNEIERYKTEIKKLKNSEAEIKALSVNYAALLREKEDHIARLNQENGSLKQNLEVANAARSSPRKDATSSNSVNGLRGGGEQSPIRQNKVTKNRSGGNQWQKGIVSKQDGHSNGFIHGSQDDTASTYPTNLREKELADMVEEKSGMLATVQSEYDLQMKKSRVELEREREIVLETKRKLQDEKRKNDSLTVELNSMRSNRNETSFEVNKLRKELDEKVSEIKQYQMELSRRANEGVNDADLRKVTAILEKENGKLKAEKEKLESALKDASIAVEKNSSRLDENMDVSTSFPGKLELEQSLNKIEKDLKETRRGRDKALQELGRLKQHLLDKELEESEKMDEDSKVIEDLRQHVEYQRATISNLERALQQSRASQEEVRTVNDHELKKLNETIDDLGKKLDSFRRTIDAKNTELMNLQTALGQYYAEIEAKEHLEGDLSLAREEISKLTLLLQDSKQLVDGSNKEKEEMFAKLAQAETMVAEWKNRVNKLEEDNAKLRRAVEQSMTRLNRMSVDSDFLVDRRIVIKLMVTYFQRNHSREVLDLMVRMLGFSDEDKQKIGAAQQGTGKGVVRGVLGFPGRFVGGIIGGSSSGTPSNMASDDQSFADLWVDFLLKESEKSKMLESMEASDGSTASTDSSKPTIPAANSIPLERRTSSSGRPPIVSASTPSINTSRSLYSYQNTRQYDTGSSEFSTVPLTPLGNHFS